MQGASSDAQALAPGSPSYDNIGEADLPLLRNSYRTPRSTPRNFFLPEQPLEQDARGGEGESHDSGVSTNEEPMDSSREPPEQRRALSPTKHVNSENAEISNGGNISARTPHKRLTPRKGVTPRQHQEDLAEVAELRALFGS